MEPSFKKYTDKLYYDRRDQLEQASSSARQRFFNHRFTTAQVLLDAPNLRRPLTSSERNRRQNRLITNNRLAMRLGNRARTMTQTKRKKRKGFTGYKRRAIWKRFKRKVNAAIGEKQMTQSYSVIGIKDVGITTANSPDNILELQAWPAAGVGIKQMKGDFIHIRYITGKFVMRNDGDNWSQNANRIVIFKTKQKAASLSYATIFDFTGLDMATGYLIAPLRPGVGKVIYDKKIYCPPTVANQNGETMKILKTFTFKKKYMKDVKREGADIYSISNLMMCVMGPTAAYRSGTGNVIECSWRMTYTDV